MDSLTTEGVVVNDTLRFIGSVVNARLVKVNLRGRILTQHGAVITVNKWLDVSPGVGSPRVRTSEYDYHAYVRLDDEASDLFRYDNCHGGLETLHRHCFCVDGTAGPISPVALDQMPPLATVIREAEYLASWIDARRAS